jgi:hypothetical protein
MNKETVTLFQTINEIPKDFTGIALLANGDKEWYVNGEYHREDGPAREWADGSKGWWKNGNPHREDGPSYEGACGEKQWRLDGLLHREDGPAIEYADGRKAWYRNMDHVFSTQELKEEYIVVERGIPPEDVYSQDQLELFYDLSYFGEIKLSYAKLLMATRMVHVPENLPGLELKF